MLSGAWPAYDALRTAASADIAVLPYQLEPALAVTRGLASRILIADEVGLGKTIQAGLVIAETLDRVDEPHVLVVVPASLRDQWRDELAERFNLPVVIADSTTLSRIGSGFAAGANPWAGQPLIVTSIDYIKRPEALRGLETLLWDLVVFDEAHALSGRSDRHRAACALAERARTVVLLTATPHSGNDDEFARLSGVGDLEPGFPLLAFRRTRADAGLTTRRRTVWLKVAPTAAEARMHLALLEYTRLIWRQKGATSSEARLVAMLLARRACSSAGALARSVERRLALLSSAPSRARQLVLPLGEGPGDDDEPGLELAAAGLYDADDERTRLVALLELARAAQVSESKLAAVRRLIRRAGEPAIVFTEYRDTLAALQSVRPDADTVVLHGGLGRTDRRAVLQRFTSGGARVLLATDAASEGLNLHQRCRLVINLELPWTPRRLDQRVGRVERIGQPRRVHEVNLLAAGTFEETTLTALARRTHRIRDVVGGLRDVRHEQEIAESVMGEPPRPTPDHAEMPAGVFTADLREAAAAEAARIVLSRRIGGGVAPPDGRACVTAVRTQAGRPRTYWAFRLEFVDSDLQPVWDTLLALEASLTRPVRLDAAGIRRLALGLSDASAATVEREHRAAAERLHAVLSRTLALASAREAAIMAAGERQRARIAAGLLQPGLFDRRVEREAADQTAALEELLARGRTRLDDLTRRRHVVAGSAAPVLGLVRAR